MSQAAAALLLLAASWAVYAHAVRQVPLNWAGDLANILESRVSGASHVQHGQVGVGNDQVPGIELAARQYLFNYATQQGLEILKSKVKDLVIPDVAKSFNLPLVGEFTLQLSNIHVDQFNVSSQEARLTIMDERFELWVTQVEAQITFNWHWEKLGMQGTGKGELDLHGGSIDYQFRVNKSETGKPHIVMDDASSKFTSVDLKITSFSADWLYQAVMSLFNDQIQRAVQNGITGALRNDVPGNLNQVLETLPTKVQITGLPFSTTFDYSIFTLTYVMVKGYGEVESELPPSQDVQAQPTTTATADQPSSQRSASPHTTSSSSHSGSHGLKVMAPCPFAATPLPLSAEDIGSDSHMTSIYLHESVVNCMLWGLFRGNALQYDLVDGSIPKLHLTTDLLVMLIPGLPKAYPHQSLKISITTLSAPRVMFTATGGTTIEASYRTSIFVSNETLSNPKIVTLSANLTIQGQLNYDSTIINSAVVHHVVEESSMPVSAVQWDNTVAWFIQNYAGLYPLQFLIDHFVQTPVTSMVSMINAQSETYDGWFALSGDVVVHPL